MSLCLCVLFFAKKACTTTIFTQYLFYNLGCPVNRFRMALVPRVNEKSVYVDAAVLLVLQAYSRQMVVLCFNRALSMDTGSGSICLILIIPFFQLGVVQISDHPAVQPPIRIHVSIQYRASGLSLSHQDFMVQVSFEHCSSRYMAKLQIL